MFDKRKFLAQMTLRDVSKKELAEKLGIKSREWASVAIPTGLMLIIGYFVALCIIL